MRSLSSLQALARFVAACGSGRWRDASASASFLSASRCRRAAASTCTGEPYQVDGVWYQPRDEPAYDRVGTASWYGELFHGRRTANGEIYDMDRLSAASPTLPLPVYARVTNLENRRSIIVRVNDRGPYASDRIMDLSRRSAEVLGFRDEGTARVRVQYLGRAPLNGDDSYERRYLASQGWAQVASRRDARGTGKPRASEVGSCRRRTGRPTPWKDTAPLQSAAAIARAAQPNAAASYGWTMVSPPKEAEAAPFDAPLYWQASAAGRREAAKSRPRARFRKRPGERTDRRFSDPGRLVQEPRKRR